MMLAPFMSTAFVTAAVVVIVMPVVIAVVVIVMPVVIAVVMFVMPVVIAVVVIVMPVVIAVVMFVMPVVMIAVMFVMPVVVIAVVVIVMPVMVIPIVGMAAVPIVPMVTATPPEARHPRAVVADVPTWALPPIIVPAISLAAPDVPHRLDQIGTLGGGSDHPSSVDRCRQRVTC